MIVSEKLKISIYIINRKIKFKKDKIIYSNIFQYILIYFIINKYDFDTLTILEITFSI